MTNSPRPYTKAFKVKVLNSCLSFQNLPVFGPNESIFPFEIDV